MSVLILEPVDADIVQWLAERHAVVYDPDLADDPQGLRAALAQARALILPAAVAMDASLLRAAPKLRVLGRISAGTENVDQDACRAAGVELIRHPEATAAAEAEFVLGALLSLLRRVPVQMEDGMWVGRELGCSTVGLIGMTPMTRVLAQLLPVMGARVLGYDPTLHVNDPLWARWGIEPQPLKELMELSDAVSVQLPYFPRYRGLLGERVLGYARPGQVLVSIAHSALFDAAALAQALQGGRLLAAWLDIVEPELMEAGRPLASAPGLQVTPRLAGTTRESRTRAAWGVARRMAELLAPTLPAPQEALAAQPASVLAQPISPA